MKLFSKRHSVKDSFGDITGYRIRWGIDKGESRMLELPLHVQSQTLEELAERWFLVFAPQLQVDTNKNLCGEPEGWRDLKAGDFFNRGWSCSDPDPTRLLAVEERVRRAWAMLTLELTHSKFFDDAQHDLSIENPTPSSVAAVAIDPPHK